MKAAAGRELIGVFGERIMIDIFTGLLGVIAISALLGTTIKILLRPPKVWDEYDDDYEEIESTVNYRELRQRNPHIWMD